MIDKINNKINELIEMIKGIDKEQVTLFIKRKWILLLVIILAIALFVGYMIGTSSSSKASLLANLEEALKGKDINLLSKVVVLNDENVSKDELKPLMDYYKNDTSKVDSTISLLSRDGETADFILNEEDGLFGKKYSLNLKTYNIKVNSNYKEGKFSYNNSSEIVSGNSFLRLIPGVYKIKGSLYSEYGNINTDTEIVLMENKEIQLDFPAVNIMVESMFSDSKIFINGKDTGYLVKENIELGPLATDGSVKIHLEKDFPWGKINSEEVSVSDIPKVTININMENDKLKEETKELVSEFYESVFKALNEKEKDLINKSTEEVKNKVYGILEESYIILKRNYKIISINISDENKEYIYENGEYTAILSVDISYEVSKTFLNLSPNENNKSFSTQITYIDGKWLVNDIENFSL